MEYVADLLENLCAHLQNYNYIFGALTTKSKALPSRQQYTYLHNTTNILHTVHEYMYVHVYTYTIRSSYITLIGTHEMHGRVHPN